MYHHTNNFLFCGGIIEERKRDRERHRERQSKAVTARLHYTSGQHF